MVVPRFHGDKFYRLEISGKLQCCHSESRFIGAKNLKNQMLRPLWQAQHDNLCSSVHICGLILYFPKS